MQSVQFTSKRQPLKFFSSSHFCTGCAMALTDVEPDVGFAGSCGGKPGSTVGCLLLSTSPRVCSSHLPHLSSSWCDATRHCSYILRAGFFRTVMHGFLSRTQVKGRSTKVGMRAARHRFPDSNNTPRDLLSAMSNQVQTQRVTMLADPNKYFCQSEKLHF
jgi:hypothetical protein